MTLPDIPNGDKLVKYLLMLSELKDNYQNIKYPKKSRRRFWIRIRLYTVVPNVLNNKNVQLVQDRTCPISLFPTAEKPV